MFSLSIALQVTDLCKHPDWFSSSRLAKMWSIWDEGVSEIYTFYWKGKGHLAEQHSTLSLSEQFHFFYTSLRGRDSYELIPLKTEMA